MGESHLLKDYQEKRDFRRTPEPRGRVRKTEGRRYLIQKHAARRLHYDLRLELDGVLKSWAVTKGPSLDPSIKRLAVRTEDHPVAYGDFEGVIPSGYGAGTVMLWDEGTWEPKTDPAKGLKKGMLKFRLRGSRLKGGFALIRMKPRNGEKAENWLLVKERDRHADEAADVLEAFDTSVATSRTMLQIEQNKDLRKNEPNRKARAQQRTRAAHRFIPPQLATLRDAPPSGDGWLHELKYDGYRIQALLKSGRVRLLTRNQKDWTHRYSGIARRLEELVAESATLDGELVALDNQGRSDFSALQKAAEGDARLAYFAFDLLFLNGESLVAEPLTKRKRLLRALLGKDDSELRFSDHIAGEGDAILQKACAMGVEGLVSKAANSRYRSGRTKTWYKAKCIGSDEFVIGGYRQSDKAGRQFSSLLLGEYVDDRLVYRGRVGTGFNMATMRALARRMVLLRRDTTPFDKVPGAARRGAVWIDPVLVAQVNYAEQTAQGVLRHASFLGLREDKEAQDVSSQRAPASRAQRGRGGDEGGTQVGGVRLTSPDKIMYPEQGATKRQIAEYYQRHAERVLGYAQDRPLSLVRCPDGRQDDCFFQRHHSGALPEHLQEIKIREKDGGQASYLYVHSAQGLISTAQIGALELHLWGVRIDRIEHPERMVFDLDPDEALGFDEVRAAALELRDVLQAADLESFPLLTGGKGIHVIVPVVRRRTWNDVKAFARGLAQRLAQAAPERYVATASKSKRSGRIFIDWLRNQRGGTAVAPYSLRARPGAPVATPVAWRELRRLESAAAYTLDNIERRLSRLKTDPWDGYAATRQSITAAHMDIVR